MHGNRAAIDECVYESMSQLLYLSLHCSLCERLFETMKLSTQDGSYRCHTVGHLICKHQYSWPFCPPARLTVPALHALHEYQAGIYHTYKHANMKYKLGVQALNPRKQPLCAGVHTYCLAFE